ncbi:MAG TPA: hypothetical protein VMW34_04305 [Anaerolineales bacterium]|nr:hypothetical protein [Anaerolineales bacterium]
MDKASSSELNAIESVMLSSLQPVDPRPEFVEGLHQRLTDPMSPTVRFTRQYSSQFILLIIATVLSGIVFILTAGRVIISLIKEFRLTKFK